MLCSIFFPTSLRKREINVLKIFSYCLFFVLYSFEPNTQEKFKRMHKIFKTPSARETFPVEQ